MDYLTNTDRRFIVLYETPKPNSWRAGQTDTKAILVFDPGDLANMPFGFEADYLGPDEDEVVRIAAVIDVSTISDPRVVIDDIEYSFTPTGAPVATGT